MAQDILAQKLVVEYEDGRRIIVGRDDLLEIEPPRGRHQRPPAASTPDLPNGDPDGDDHGG